MQRATVLRARLYLAADSHRRLRLAVADVVLPLNVGVHELARLRTNVHA